MIDYIIPVALILVAILLVILAIIGESKKKRYRQRILDALSDLFYRHNKLSIGMSESEMIDIMDFRFDKTCEEDKTTYRFVFVTRGGSGESHGFIGGRMANNYGSLYGESHGYSEQHDESYVVVECKENKVTKILPYNMNDIRIPLDYAKLLRFADNLGIDYRD